MTERNTVGRRDHLCEHARLTESELANGGGSTMVRAITQKDWSMLIIGPARRVIHSDVSRWLISMTWAHQSPTRERREVWYSRWWWLAVTMWLQLVNERNLDVECNCVGVGRIGRKFIALNSPARSNHVQEEEVLMSTVRTMFWLCFLFMNSWGNELWQVSWQIGSMHLMNGERWISAVYNRLYRWPSELLESHKIIRIVAKRVNSVRIDFVWNLSVHDLVEINCVREPLIQLKDLVSLPPVSFRHCLGFFIMLLSIGVGDSPSALIATWCCLI